jgi:hypothetical protein
MCTNEEIENFLINALIRQSSDRRLLEERLSLERAKKLRMRSAADSLRNRLPEVVKSDWSKNPLKKALKYYASFRFYFSSLI